MNPIDSPLVSILLPVYNGEKYLPEALNSLLSQTVQNFEIIAIDDGSQDQTGAILENYEKQDARIRVFHQDNQGIIATLNRGLCHARGKYLARMDADDISLPNRVEAQVGYLEHHPEAVLAGAAYELIDTRGKTIHQETLPEDDTHIRWQLLFHNAIAHPASIFRVDLIHSSRLSYNPEAVHSEDYEFWTRILKHGFACNLPEILIKRRVHSNQVTDRGKEQVWSAANRISHANIRELGIVVTDSEVQLLRKWYYRFPRKFTPADRDLATRLLQILNTFCRLPYLDLRQVRLVRGQWVGKVLAALPTSKLTLQWAGEISARLYPFDLFCLVSYLQKKQRIKGPLQQKPPQAGDPG